MPTSIICPQSRVVGTLFLLVALEIQEVVEILALSEGLVHIARAKQWNRTTYEARQRIQVVVRTQLRKKY